MFYLEVGLYTYIITHTLLERYANISTYNISYIYIYVIYKKSSSALILESGMSFPLNTGVIQVQNGGVETDSMFIGVLLAHDRGREAVSK